jgi:hypothetical protein
MLWYKSPLTFVTFGWADSERATSGFADALCAVAQGKSCLKALLFFCSNIASGKAEKNSERKI